MKNILFICTGNTCRSIMAEGFFNEAVKKYPSLTESFIALSAGIMAMDGDTASNNSIQVLKNGWDIDISKHKARSIKYEYIKNAYYILTMTQSHKDAVLKLFPEMVSKVYTLKEFAGTSDVNPAYNNYDFDFSYNFSLDIPDPYGKSIQFYNYCAQEIKKNIDLIIEQLNTNVA